MSQAFIALHDQFRYAATEPQAHAAYDAMPQEYRDSVSRDTLVNYLTSRRRNSFYWYDYEAGGTDARSAPVTQHAGIRTDTNLNVLDVPNDWLCKLHGDKLPHPVAIALTGINPMDCVNNGVPEPVFFRYILQEKAVPGTCSVGYNSMKYDEEMTRFGLWRNLLPVYRREFENGNSKWDLFTVTAAVKALSPADTVWPTDEDNKVRLKLEMLSTANGITQENAHNALDDVKALIDWARHLRAKAPALWHYLYENRTKKAIGGKIRIGTVGQLVSPFLGSENDFMSTVLFIGQDPSDKNKFVYIDLDRIQALRACWKLDARTLHERLISPREVLEASGEERPPIGSIAVNKCPAFFSFDWLAGEGMLTDELANDRIEKEATAERILLQPEFVERLLAAVSMGDYLEEIDPELCLYGDGFLSTKDEQHVRLLMAEPVEKSFAIPLEWDNPKLAVLWERARFKLGDSHVELTSAEQKRWGAHCQGKLSAPLEGGGKHEKVNLASVEGVLAETDMPDVLRQGYVAFLNTLPQ